MSLGTDYHRYKQKLERLQTKVKKSELARKELEIRLQRLMKERNECEKSASIHKTKYNTLLEHERKRLNRNGELLEMIEDVNAKANAMASNTERLKKLKNQQDRILINNWRRTAYVQQHILYPNTLYPNATQYLPSAPYDHQSQRAVSGIPTDNCSSIVYEKPAIFIESAMPPNSYSKSHELHSPNTAKSMLINPLVQQSTMNQIHGSNLIPIYNNELRNSQMNLLHPQYHMNQCFSQPMVSNERADGPIPNVIDSNKVMRKELSNLQRNDNAAFIPTRVNDTAHLSYPTNQSNYNRHLNMDSSLINHPYAIEHPEKFSLDETFHKPLDASSSQFIKNPQYLYSNSPYSPIDRENYTHATNQNQNIPISELRSNQNVNIPSGGASEFGSQQMSETMSHFLANLQQNQPTHPTKYDKDGRDIRLDDGPKDYEKSLNYRINERNPDDMTKDYYGEEKTAEQSNYFSRPVTLDTNKSMSTTSTTGSNMTSSLSEMAQKTTTNLSFEDDSKPNSRPKVEDISSKSQQENSTDSIYSSLYKKDWSQKQNPTNTNPAAPEEPLSITSFKFDGQEKALKSDEKNEKRRSSIDAGSFAKTLGYDTDSEKESIAANLRRRYSVAANFLNLQNPAPNLDAFNFTPTSTEGYRNASNSNDETNTTKYNGGYIDSKADANENSYDGGVDTGGAINTISTYDPAAIHSARIEQNTERTVTTTHNEPVSTSNTSVSQYPGTVTDANLMQAPALDDNQQINVDPNDTNTTYTSKYSTYAPEDQTYVENAMEQLNLGNDDEQEGINETQPIQYDSVDKMRTHSTTHSKTVTWADDPNSNYKNEDNSSNVYETQNVSNEVADGSYYMENPESQPIPNQYTADATILPGMESNDAQYQYQYDSQYDNNQYQSADGTSDPNMYSSDYYENENQYDQYGNQQQQQPLQQQQEDPQNQMQYYGNDAVVVNSSGNVTDDSYQQYPTDSTQQVQPKQDEYYSVQPGENYYNDDYGNYDDNQTYSTNTNVGNSSQMSSVSNVPTEQTTHIPQTQPDMQYAESNDQVRTPHIPNYLQSDTDDSQIGYQNIANNRQAPQSQDSDFEFSINS